MWWLNPYMLLHFMCPCSAFSWWVLPRAHFCPPHQSSPHALHSSPSQWLPPQSSCIIFLPSHTHPLKHSLQTCSLCIPYIMYSPHAVFPILPPTSLTARTLTLLLILHLVAPLLLLFWGPLYTPILITPQHEVQYLLINQWTALRALEYYAADRKNEVVLCVLSWNDAQEIYSCFSPQVFIPQFLPSETLFLVSYSRNVCCIN